MNLRQSLRTIVSLLMLVLLAVITQNCSALPGLRFSTLTFPSLSSSASSGGGDGYDGKPDPGNYVRTYPEFDCQENNYTKGVQSFVSVTDTSVLLIKDNCNDPNYDLGIYSPLLNSTYYDRDFFIFGHSVFEKVDSVSNNAQQGITEVFCRVATDSNGIDVVIRSAASSSSSKTSRIYRGKNGVASRFNDFDVSESVSGPQTIYRANNFDFELTVDRSGPAAKSYPGTLIATLDGEAMTSRLTCTHMSPEPILTVSPQGLLVYYQLNLPQLANGSLLPDSLVPSNSSTFYTAGGTVNLVAGILGLGFSLPLDQSPLGNANAIKMTNAFLPSSNATISYWYRFPSTSSLNESFALCMSDLNGNRLGVGLANSANGNNLVFASYPNATSETLVQSNLIISPNNWHHIAAAYSDTAITITVNGTQTFSSPRVDPGNNVLPDRRAIFMGACSDISPNTDNGVLDELSLWNRSLAPNEINEIFKKGHLVY